jgi:hypothetical protein
MRRKVFLVIAMMLSIMQARSGASYDIMWTDAQGAKLYLDVDTWKGEAYVVYGGELTYPVLTIPEKVLYSVGVYLTVREIRVDAFKNSTKLIRINIPNTVTKIDESAFTGCTGLRYIEVSSSNPNYSEDNGVLYNKNKTILIVYPTSALGQSSYKIPQSVTIIKDSAFSSCTYLNRLEVNWGTPLTISSNVFINMDLSTCTLVVPDGTKTFYETAGIWKDFGTIVEKAETAIPQVADERFSAYPSVTFGIVHINNPSDEAVKVYSLSGKLLLTSNLPSIDLSDYPIGIYLLRSGGKTAKVIKH